MCAGKSTTLKSTHSLLALRHPADHRADFQLAFAPKAWQAERASWRAVIQLNLVRSINSILDVLSQEMASSPSTTSPTTSPFMRPTTAQGANRFDPSTSTSPTDGSSTSSDPDGLQFTNTHALLKLRLAPLRRVEADLKQLIGAATDELAPDAFGAPAQAADDANGAVLYDGSPPRRRPAEFYVRSNQSWRDALRSTYQGAGAASERAAAAHESKLENATEIIASCAVDMEALWADPVVREVLRRRRMRIEQAPGL